ncbi:MAG: hypothetical protein U0T69_09520 [Chitinophagales bacterium]
MKNKVYIFILKVLIFSSPIMALLASYIYLDPMRVIKKYPDYEKDCFVALNRDFIGTEIYKQNKEKLKYNAFIFGNSRSLSFLCNDWQIYIPGGSPLHYDASGESIKAVSDKIKYIDESNGKLRYALIIMDPLMLSVTDPMSGPLVEPHPTVSKTSWIGFHSVYFKAYLSEFYFVKYIDYSYSRKYKPYMKGVIETRPINYNAVTNDFYLKIYDEALEKDPQKYIKEHIEFYPERDTNQTRICNAVIGNKQIAFLNDIKDVFLKQKTNYKIIISPLYSQEYFNKSDLEKLISIFGKEHVYDFSGKNEYTRHIENFYESFHYRPKVARDIMRRIYIENQ